MQSMLRWNIYENSGLNMGRNHDRVGVIVSSGIGGLQELEDQIIRMYERGDEENPTNVYSKALSNMGVGIAALKIKLRGYVNCDNSLCFCQ